MSLDRCGLVTRCDLRDISVEKNLIDHPNLVVLSPYMDSYCERGLTNLLAGKRSFPASAIETYAREVYARVDELEAALTSLRLACRFVTELGSELNPSPTIYRYHYENFVLRASCNRNGGSSTSTSRGFSAAGARKISGHGRKFVCSESHENRSPRIV